MICSVQDVPVQVCTLRSRHPFGENSNVATVFAVLAQCFPLNPSGNLLNPKLPLIHDLYCICEM